jgi:3-hydroxyacyl-[acyl-carrier-protein] dehydratase
MADEEKPQEVQSIDLKKDVQLNVERIMRLIPHRYPMLLVDRLINIKEDSATGIKNVTINEPFFQGHFPAQPVMPGVLLIETMAQTAGVLVMHNLGEEADGKVVYFMGVDEARFRKPVVPGDSLRVHVVKDRNRGRVWKFSAHIMVEEALVAEAKFSAMIVDIN